MAAVPSDVVILQDHLRLFERLKALRAAHPNVCFVSPAHKATQFHTPVEPPPEWMSGREDLDIDRKCWLKADAMGLAASTLVPAADYYWFIESDVAATQAVWKALFDEFRTNRADCLATRICYRDEDPRMEKYFTDAPAEANRHFVMALYRLSRAAVEASIAEAPSLRECFSEIAVPWVMQKHGMKVGRINGNKRFHSSLSFATKQNHIRVDTNLLNHPCKLNTFGP